MQCRPAFRFLWPAWSGLRSPLPWALFGISLACALTAWTLLRAEARERGLRAFELRVQRIAETFREELRDIALGLRGNAAMLSVNGPNSPRAWRDSLEAMESADAYPGLEAIGYAPARAGTAATTTMVFPANGPHARALGVDLLSGDSLREALTPLIRSGERAAFLHPAPWLRPASAQTYLWLTEAVGDPRHPPGEPHGVVWGLVRLDRLITGLIDDSDTQIAIELRAGAGAPEDQLLYARDNNAGVSPATLKSAVHQKIQLHDKAPALSLIFAPGQDYYDEFDSAKARAALGGGLLLSALLFLIAWYSATVSQRAEELARMMTSAHGRVQARLQGIIGTAMDAIITVDEHQNITMFNHAAETIFGYRAQDIIGQPLDRLIPVGQRGRHHEHVRKFGDTGDTARAMGNDITVTGLRANGEVFPIDASISRLKEGEHVLYTVILRDITRRRQAEAALAHTQAHLQHSNERLRQLSLHVETTREAERIRIAREIHDDLAATLTGIKMDLSAARDALRDDPERAGARLRASLGLMDAAVVTTRRIINDLRPSILDNLGVWAAIEWLAEETARRAGIRCEARIDPALEDVEVPPAVSTALFRIVQEALNNVWRHAQATSASVRCSLSDRHLEVAIVDDGRGMDLSSQQRSGHWGLLGMEERVRSHDGSIAIDSTPGRGTSILVRVPLPI